MKKIPAFLLVLPLIICSCAPSSIAIQNAIASTRAVWTTVPSQTPYPTLTPQYTQTPYSTLTPLIVTQVYVQTPTPDVSAWGCEPLTDMNYADNSKAAVLLQAYVSKLSGVRSVSYTIPERLYSNVLSQIIFVSFVNEKDGKVYSKRFIVYMDEDPKLDLGWKNGVFSIDGQCWIDGPR